MRDLTSFELPHAGNRLRPKPARAASLPSRTKVASSPAHTETASQPPRPEAVDYPPRTEAVDYPPRTEAVRRALDAGGGALAADLVFLEAWESQAPPDIAATLRAGQIRRANRHLAAEIRAELRRGRPLSESERAALGAELAGS